MRFAMPTPSDLIVVNTGPLIALDACSQIDLLNSFYKRVVVPEEVEKELRAGGKTALCTGLTAEHRKWIEVLSLSKPPSPALLAQLDLGEATVISLAVELKASVVLIDEKNAYKIAQSMGLTTIRSIGILLRAKKKGILEEIKPCIYEMSAKGIWLSDRLIRRSLQEAGEDY